MGNTHNNTAKRQFFVTSGYINRRVSGIDLSLDHVMEIVSDTCCDLGVGIKDFKDSRVRLF